MSGGWRWRAGVVLLLAAWMPASARADEVLVSAASSLTDAMNSIGTEFTRANPGTIVRFNFASSGVLQRQIEQGAPVDIFVAASPVEMDALQREKLILPATRVVIAGNRLVLIVPPHSSVRRWEDLAKPSVRRIALSDPASVPSGRYARDTLVRRHLWASVSPKAILGANVRQTLTYVVSGDVDAGVVFATDARQRSGRVHVAAMALPGKDHAPIVYPAAVITRAPNEPAARRFVEFLKGSRARAILARYGFSPPPHPSTR